MKTQLSKPTRIKASYTDEYKQQALELWRASGRTCSIRSANSAGLIGWPFQRMRSSMCSKCGDVNSPVPSPAALRIAVTMAAVEPLPLVPAMWTIA